MALFVPCSLSFLVDSSICCRRAAFLEQRMYSRNSNLPTCTGVPLFLRSLLWPQKVFIEKNLCFDYQSDVPCRRLVFIVRIINSVLFLAYWYWVSLIGRCEWNGILAFLALPTLSPWTGSLPFLCLCFAVVGSFQAGGQ